MEKVIDQYGITYQDDLRYRCFHPRSSLHVRSESKDEDYDEGKKQNRSAEMCDSQFLNSLLICQDGSSVARLLDRIALFIELTRDGKEKYREENGSDVAT